MGTEVLRPHDLLAERFHGPPPTFYRRRNIPPAENLIPKRNNNTNTNRKTSPRPDKKKQFESKKPQQHRRKDDVAGSPPPIGKVTLLRRGESLDSLTNQKPKATKSPNRGQKPVDDMAVIGTGRIGPEMPEMVPKQIRVVGPVDMYAGSAFSMSPSPRALPLPSFFNKQVNDPASRDLRRLLRLE